MDFVKHQKKKKKSLGLFSATSRKEDPLIVCLHRWHRVTGVAGDDVKRINDRKLYLLDEGYWTLQYFLGIEITRFKKVSLFPRGNMHLISFQRPI